jgi:hypothetical protein
MLVLACLPGGSGAAAAEPPSFERDVRPLLEAKCFACHSSGKRKHGLDLRQRRLIVRGGDSGPAVVPAKAAASLLFQKASSGAMPPGDREKLGAAELDVLRRWIDAGAPTAAEEPPLAESPDDFVTPEDRQHWAFRPLSRAEPPPAQDGERARTPIDAFLLERLRGHGLGFAPDAAPRALVRRASFDLVGLPPEPHEVAAFLADDSPDALERLVDRLLASPRHGERWGRHWLDIAGYADSDGGGDADPERPHAWRYRDHVIRSLNADKLLGRFVEEQLAGDELAGYPGCELTPETIELLEATGFLRCAPDGTAQGGAEAAQARSQVIAGAVGNLGSGLLGLTLACAQCHDHRYDPISQRDYHRIRAALEPAFDVERWKAPDARRISLYTGADRARAAAVAKEAEGRRAERDAREAEAVKAVVEKLIAEKLPVEERDLARAAFESKADARTPEQKALIDRHPFLKISGGTLYQYDQAAADRIKALDAEVTKVLATRPPEDFVAATWEEPGRLPPSRLLVRGQPDQPAEEVPPGPLAVLVPAAASLAWEPASPAASTSGRRLALARWLTSPEQPLLWRAVANRVWAHHFGRGIAATPGDLGTQGDAPSHPELLDWLAGELQRSGGSLKHLHRDIVLSTAYRQSAVVTQRSRELDPDGVLLSRKPILRLEGEAVRDALLASSGALSLRAGGPPVPVREDADGSIVVGVDQKADSNRPGEEVPIGEEAYRRTVYVQVRRSRPLGFTAAFDVPVMETNCTRRNVSTVAPQALTLLNGGFAREQARILATRLEAEAPDDAARVRLAFERCYTREASAEELDEALAFLAAERQERKEDPAASRTALANLCHALLCASEMMYVE